MPAPLTTTWLAMAAVLAANGQAPIVVICILLFLALMNQVAVLLVAGMDDGAG